MKRLLLSIVGTLACFISIYAQPCKVTNLFFNLRTYDPTGQSCKITFDIGWDQESNNGSKYSFVHLWLASDYPTTHNFTATNAGPLGGTGGILTSSKSFGTITILNGALSTAGYPNGATPTLTGTLTKTNLANGVVR